MSLKLSWSDKVLIQKPIQAVIHRNNINRYPRSPPQVGASRIATLVLTKLHCLISMDLVLIQGGCHNDVEMMRGIRRAKLSLAEKAVSGVKLITYGRRFHR